MRASASGSTTRIAERRRRRRDGVDPAAVGVGVREPGAGAVAMGDGVEDEREDRACGLGGPQGRADRRADGRLRGPVAHPQRRGGRGDPPEQGGVGGSCCGQPPSGARRLGVRDGPERPAAGSGVGRRLVAEHQRGSGRAWHPARAFVADALRHAGGHGDGGGDERGYSAARACGRQSGCRGDEGARQRPRGDGRHAGAVGSSREGPEDGSRSITHAAVRFTEPAQRERTGEGRPVVPDRPSRAGWSRPLRRLSLAAGDPVRRTGHCTSPTQKAQSVTLGLLLVTERTVPTRSRCDQSFGQVGPGRGGGHVHQGQAPRFLNYGKCAYRHAL